MTISNIQLIDTLGLGAFWDEARSEVSSMIPSQIAGGAPQLS